MNLLLLSQPQEEPEEADNEEQKQDMDGEDHFGFESAGPLALGDNRPASQRQS